jgi:hypothetical protein
MAVQRDDPYGAFNFKVTITPASGTEVRGGFSDVSGLGTEVTYAHYRNGTDPANRPRKVPLMYKANDVTLKVTIRRVPRLFDLHAVLGAMFCCFFQFQGSNS